MKEQHTHTLIGEKKINTDKLFWFFFFFLINWHNSILYLSFGCRNFVFIAFYTHGKVILEISLFI